MDRWIWYMLPNEGGTEVSRPDLGPEGLQVPVPASREKSNGRFEPRATDPLCNTSDCFGNVPLDVLQELSATQLTCQTSTKVQSSRKNMLPARQGLLDRTQKFGARHRFHQPDIFFQNAVAM